MRISDWSSDVCSSDLAGNADISAQPGGACAQQGRTGTAAEIDRAFPEPESADIDPVGAHTAASAVERERPGRREDAAQRSAERRVGKESVSPCRSRWSPYP